MYFHLRGVFADAQAASRRQRNVELYHFGHCPRTDPDLHAECIEGVKIKKHFSTVMAPDYLILVMNTEFKPGLKTEQLAEIIERITRHIQKECP